MENALQDGRVYELLEKVDGDLGKPKLRVVSIAGERPSPQKYERSRRNPPPACSIACEAGRCSGPLDKTQQTDLMLSVSSQCSFRSVGAPRP
jgi:hypothetical protein